MVICFYMQGKGFVFCIRGLMFPDPPSPQLEVPVQLRPYQQEGVNWLAFLRRFGLHGVLADDMVGGIGQAGAVKEWG